MKKVYLLLLSALAQTVSAQQLSNTTFDSDWVNCYPWEAGSLVSTERGTQPEGWCISNVSQTALPIVGEEVTPGANGSGKAVKLFNVKASIGDNTAPGYITLGTAFATAETKMTSVRNADGGVFGGIAFSYHPDAVRLTYKSDRSAGEENISVIAYLWKGTWTQAEVPSNTAVGVFSWGEATKVTMTDRIQNILGKDCLTGGEITKTDDAALIASAEYYSNVAQDEWVTKEIPLNYGEYAGQPVDVEKLNIVIASNGLFDDRETIKSGNSVTVDDVELVYYHALSSLSFEDAVLDFSEETTNYDLSSVAYDETKLSYTVKGQAATASTAYNEETGVLTIRVEGEDIAINAESFTEYTIQFGKEEVVEPEIVYAYQLPNTSFDAKWVDCYPWEAGAFVSSARGSQPEGWCISNVSNSAMPIVATEEVGADGMGKSVKLSNVTASIGGQNAPAYITLGIAFATAETMMTSVRNADGGVFGGIAFNYHPDAVRLTYKSDRSAGEENMSVIAYLWKGTWTQAEVPSNTAVGVFSWGEATKVTMTDRIQNILGKDCLTGGEITKTDDAALIASAEYYSNVAQDEWVTKEIPLNYGEYAGQPVDVEKLNIVIASNGLFDDRETIKSGNSVTVDDVELVYYHALSSISYEGASLLFSEGVTSYNLSYMYYDETKLAYTVKGQAATASTAYDEETGVLTIRVEGEDISANPESFTEYTVQFKTEDDEPVLVDTKVYPLDLYVTIAGETGAKQVAQILVESLNSGNINFVLKDFVLNSGDEQMPIGNIVVKDLEVAEDGSFSFKGGIQLEDGSDPTYTMWYGPMITSMTGGSVPVDLTGKFIDEERLIVYISIDMEAFVGYKVIVHLGYARATMAVNSDTKYGTFCAPFTVTLPNNVQAYTVDDATTNGLLLLSKVNFFIPANTPVVVTAEEGLDFTEFYGLPVDGSPVSGMLTGVYEDTEVPANSYVLWNVDGKAGFYPAADVKQTVVGANRCYINSDAGTSAFFFEVEDVAGHVPFALDQDLYNTLKYSTQGGQAWDGSGGIRLGNSSEIFKWGNKFYVMSITGIPDKLSFRYQSSSGASSRQYVVYESPDGENFTEIWRDNRGSGVDGNSYQSPDIQLSPDTRFIKFFYYGNCAAYYREVYVSELVKFESDIHDMHLNEEQSSVSFTFTHANASMGKITVTAPDALTVEAPVMVGGRDVYEQQTIKVSYDVNDPDVDDYIVISNGTQTEKIHVLARMEDPVAIQGIKAEPEGTAVFNLSGQRIGKMQKGVNIVNGKKVLK